MFSLMATKAERFRAEAQRAAQKVKRPKIPSGRRGPAKDDVPNPTSHNESARARKNATYELEVSSTARPSRKSTRLSPTHIKTDSVLRITAMNRNATPKARAGRRGGDPM
jgi:hypothetical protein